MNRWTAGLVGVSLLAAAFVAAHHDYVPMWVEGMPEYEHQILAALGYAPLSGACEGVVVGGHFVPLGLNTYTGAASTYLDLPASYLWLRGSSTDPYLYRYASIFVLLASAWLFYAILRREYGPSSAFYGAAIFLVCPIEVLVGLTDHRVLLTLTLFVMGTLFFGLRYRKSGRAVHLWACCFLAGLSLWSRPEALVLPLVSLVLFGAVFCRKEIADWWRALAGRRLAHLAGAAALFVVGSAPVAAYNLQCPGEGYFHLLGGQIVPNLGQGNLGEKLLTRLQQFVSFNLLNLLPQYEMDVRNIVLAAAFLAAVFAIVRVWVGRRRPNYPLFALAVLLPTFVFSATGFRELHLLILEPAVIAVAIHGCTLLAGERRWLGHALLASVAICTGAVTALNWNAWHELPPTRFTTLNQSDPPLLAAYLKEHYSGDELFYTNIGFPQYIEYVSKGSLEGKDILNWFSVDAFDRDVKMALVESGRERVFVAIPPEREGLGNALPRTKRLYQVLDAAGVAYQTVRLKNDRNAYLYDLVVVKKGLTPPAKVADQPNIVIESVGWNDARDGVVTGTISGKGFQKDDAVIVDGDMIFSTAFGNDHFITTAIPVSRLGAKQTSRVEVFRPSTMERSKPFQTAWEGHLGR